MQAFAGIVTVSVGHCHPKVVQAVDRQNHLLQHTTNIYLNNEIAEYAQELTAKLPGKLNVSLACVCACCSHVQRHACPLISLAVGLFAAPVFGNECNHRHVGILECIILVGCYMSTSCKTGQY